MNDVKRYSATIHYEMLPGQGSTDPTVVLATDYDALDLALNTLIAEHEKVVEEVERLRRERVRIRLVLGLTPYDEGPVGLPESVIALRADAERYRWYRYWQETREQSAADLDKFIDGAIAAGFEGDHAHSPTPSEKRP